MAPETTRPPSNASHAEKLQWFLDSLPDYSKLEFEDSPTNTDTDADAPDVEKLNIKDETPEEKVDGLVKAFLDIGGPEVLTRRSRAKEEEVKEATTDEKSEDAGITDKVAKESSDSTASTHQHHDVDTGASSGGTAYGNAHKANPGPVHADKLPEPASKEELKKRAEELNK